MKIQKVKHQIKQEENLGLWNKLIVLKKCFKHLHN